MEGILLKWVNYMNFWQERKFILKGAVLSYYIPENSLKKPKRRIFLGLVDIKDREVKEGEKDNFEFEIENGCDHYFIRAKDKNEKQNWINGLKNGKLIGEKMLREGAKISKDNYKEFKKIYNDKIRKKYEKFGNILKDINNIFNYIEGKEELKIDNNINNNQNINKKNNQKFRSKIVYKKLNLSNNKNKNISSIKNKQKNINNTTFKKNNIIDNKPQGKLTVSYNNFTEKGYILEGEEFFDMDEEESFDIKIKKSSNDKIIPKQAKEKEKDKGCFYDPLYSYERRTSLPEKNKNISLNLFNILKNLVGKDISHVAMPIYLNEPLSLLQKYCEGFQYAYLLNTASKESDPHLRLAYAATFIIASNSMNIHRTKKLFNPLLFETYEYIDNKLNYRYIAEQVSHHPAISAFFAEGEGWQIFWNNNSKVKISLYGTMDISFTEKCYINFENFDDNIYCTKPNTKVRNILSTPEIEFIDEFFVKNKEGDECIVKMISFDEEKKYGNLKGEVKDINGNIIYNIKGNWLDNIKIINNITKEEKIIWEIIKSKGKDEHYFQPYTFDLNNLTEDMKKILPITDSRFRKDLRLIESQNFEEGEKEKFRLEEKQRERRKKNEKEGINPKPKYFEETYDDITGELIYKYKGNYFEDRKNKNFGAQLDIFG